ncbi:glycosyltransferase family 2 protein [Luteimicrobium sp. DT211]|uniref:glycosyltransferase family 2 protein n=1 Tax=Luteimicrobium sp. DT211 TaxID=3393412 RepID=UPI003CE8EC14
MNDASALSTAPADAGASIVSAVTGTVPVVASVTAVIVTRGANPWFRRTLAAVRAQHRAPTRLVVVDVATSNATSGYADLQLGDARFVAAPRARTFGEGVTAALREEPDGQWLWLLHDDSAPDPGALGALLRAVEHSSAVAVAGAKQRRWSAHPAPGVSALDPDARRIPELVEVGVTTSRAGRRVSVVEPHEIDQGQHDGRDDVLGVGLAGALVRRSVWDALGGTDPELGAFGDGLDLCRRARLAGHRVVVVPGAVVEHAQLALHRVDPADPARLDDPDLEDAADESFGARRRSEVYLRLVGAPLALLPALVVWLVVCAPFRAMYRLALKQPAHARDELLAPLLVLVRVPGLVRGRRSARRTSTVPRRAVRPLQQDWREGAARRRERRLGAAEQRRSTFAPSELERAELAQLATRRRVALGVVALALVVLTGLVFASFTGALASGERLVGGALLPASSSWGELWSAATSGWVQSGFGHAAPADPVLAVVLGASVLTLGHVQVAVNLLIGASFLAAGLGAWFAAGALTRWNPARAWAALVWAASPALLLAVGQGRLGALVAHAALPWFVLATVRGVGVVVDDRIAPAAGPLDATGRGPARRLGSPSLGALAAAALLLVPVAAGAPALLAVCVAAVVVAAVATAVTSARPRRYLRLLLVPVPALVVLGPFLWHVGRTWGRQGGGWRLLLASPGNPTGYDDAAPWQSALGWPVPPSAALGTSGTWVTVVAWAFAGSVAAVAVVALVRSRRPVAVRVAWLLAAVGLALAVAAPLVTVATSASGLVRAWPGPGTSLVLAGLLGAALLGLPERTVLRGRYDERHRGRETLRGAVVVLALALPCAAVGTWVAHEVDGTHHTVGDLALTGTPVVPPVGQQMQASGARLLLLDAAPAAAQPDATPTVRYTLPRADGTQLVDASVVVDGRAARAALEGRTPAPSAPEAQLAQVVAQLAGDGVAPSSRGLADAMSDLGIGGVLLPADGTGGSARSALTARLDTVPGLARVTEGQASVLWRVALPGASAAQTSTSGAWATLRDADGTVLRSLSSQDAGVDATLPARKDATTLVLASHAHDHWRATLDGHALARAGGDDWQQEFTVPAGQAGHLVVAYDAPHRALWLWSSGVLLLVVVLLALPVRRRRAVLR